MEQGTQQPASPSGYARKATAKLRQNIGEGIHKLGIHPDAVSLAALLFCLFAAIAIADGRFVLAGWLMLASGFFDIADGAVARVRGEARVFGAVLDSTLDRYADGFIFFSFSYYFASQNRMEWMLLSFAALMGSYVVSYVRARASGADVNVTVKNGWFTRLERLMIVIIALWLHNWLLLPALWLLAIGTNITALQRLWIVRQKTEV
jgi:CDP-diacylglycerol--glycerol-3-phosphate 3-phosphatidyltransferase